MPLHIFIYEWVTGGGLVEEALPPSLLAEGAAMAAAVASDFCRLDNCRVSVLRDSRLMGAPLIAPLIGCRQIQVDSRAERRQQFARLVEQADYALVIAPEFDGILASTVAHVHDLGLASLNASRQFLAAATNKQITADMLALAGIRVPEAVLIDADQVRLPAEFEYPGVLKPLDGAGSQHTLLVEGPGDLPPAYPWPRRLERYVPGRPASVAVLCGPLGFHVLPPCWQRLSDDGRFTYLGGRLIVEAALCERATFLALRALKVLPPAHGYVGVDLVLGADPAGDDDVVIEVNPRLTTSYVGLRAAVAENLAGAMLRVAQGEATQFTLARSDVEFTAHGHVR